MDFSKLWKVLAGGWRGILAIGALLGILYLPQDIGDLPQALKRWGPVVGVFTRDTALFAFAILCAGWIVWSDIRPFAKEQARRWRMPSASPRSNARSDWEQEWHELRFRRSDFWSSATDAYNYWNEEHGQSALRELLEAASFPLELPLNQTQKFADWVWDFSHPNLTGATRALNDFAAAIYPAVKPPRAANSLIFLGGHAEFLRFDDYRRDLSKFWDHWGRQEPLEQVIREQKADGLVRNHANEIKLLTYLEIARERWAQEGAAGKSGLFKLGKRNAETTD
jgi:hypothetical protein